MASALGATRPSAKLTSSRPARSAADEDRPAEPSRSKMDKYFDPAYDPRLDINVDDLTDQQTGFIGEGNFAEWDSMLKVMRDRKEEKRRDKEDKERRKQEKRDRRERREESSEDEEERRERRKRKKREQEAGIGGLTDAQRTARKEVGLLDIEGYAPKGKVREWDMGK